MIENIANRRLIKAIIDEINIEKNSLYEINDTKFNIKKTTSTKANIPTERKIVSFALFICPI
ncbi:MAG TPA: hypothetical protein VMV36_02085 [Ignavibacteriaceae bacterium]|nr:hypothetical protein [Ignavibacteriaceae bacterium]